MDRRRLLAAGGAAALAGLGGGLYGLHGMGSMADYNAAMAASRAALRPAPAVGDLISFAALAPSGHNSQPWRFRPGPNTIDILPDFTRRTPVVDPDDHHLFVALGCAAETLAIAAAARSRPGEISVEPGNGGSVRFAFASGQRPEHALFDAIAKRQSTRAIYSGEAVAVDDLRTLAKAAAVPGVDLVLITDRAGIDRVAQLIVAGNSQQIADRAFLEELKTWLRFNPRRALETGDGLFSATSGSPILPDWLGPKMFDLAFKTRSENDKYVRQLASSAGVAIFVSQGEDKAHWIAAGRACQRFALQATALGLKHAFVNQPVEVASLRPELASLVGLPGRRPDLVMRFGYGPALPYAARRATERMIVA